VSDPVTVTDYDECQVHEGTELQLQGRGFAPYPSAPGPWSQLRPGHAESLEEDQ
jgi:hypothetical protein